MEWTWWGSKHILCAVTCHHLSQSLKGKAFTPSYSPHVISQELHATMHAGTTQALKYLASWYMLVLHAQEGNSYEAEMQEIKSLYGWKKSVDCVGQFYPPVGYAWWVLE